MKNMKIPMRLFNKAESVPITLQTRIHLRLELYLFDYNKIYLNNGMLLPHFEPFLRVPKFVTICP